MPSRPCFQIGLTMAGAISAGAYSAGVVDFLLEALDAIEDVRAGNAARVKALTEGNHAGMKPVFDPPHEVQISTMSGTSAGSMVTAIVATILGTRVAPVGPTRKATDAGATGNPLYDAWVQDIHYDKLLSIGDLAGGAHVLSLLNSDQLGAIVAQTLRFASHDDYVRPYVAEAFPVYFCISNLRGVRYSLQLNVDRGVASEYQMSLHADWMGFNWSKDALEREGLVSVAPAATQDAWTTLGNAALASGAFPIGLASRDLKRRFVDYIQRDWFIPGALLPPTRRLDANGNPVMPADSPQSWVSHAGEYEKIPPLDKATDFPGGIYDFLNVDGGIFDNEPIELARRELAGTLERNPRDGLIADRAVILIDPFPNLFDLDPHYDAAKERDLLEVVKSLLPAMIAQARFKLDELALIKDPSVASRYAIMPIRYDTQDKPEKYAIASGALGGFGGFLSKEFRHHDYMLGRRNCQRFLSNHFMLPADFEAGIVNPLFAGWTDPALRKAFEVRDDYVGADGVTRQVAYLPIVPLLGKLASSDYAALPPWPARPFDLHRDALKTAILARADALKGSLVAQYQPAWVLNLGMKYFWWQNKDQWIEQYAMQPVEASLAERGIGLR